MPRKDLEAYLGDRGVLRAVSGVGLYLGVSSLLALGLRTLIRRTAGATALVVDHFKTVKDRGGHAAGDRTFRNVARTLRAAVRAGDAVMRLGGEEFLILLHQSGIDGSRS